MLTEYSHRHTKSGFGIYAVISALRKVFKIIKKQRILQVSAFFIIG